MKDELTMKMLWLTLFIFSLSYVCDSRVHNFTIQSDNRHQIQLSQFGFLVGGMLSVNLSLFHFTNPSPDKPDSNRMRFTVVKTPNTGISHYYLSQDDICEEPFHTGESPNDVSSSAVYLFLDFASKSLKLKRGRKNPDLNDLSIEYKPDGRCAANQTKNDSGITHCHCLQPGGLFESCIASFDGDVSIPITQADENYFIFFSLHITRSKEEGLYTLFFHNCDSFKVSFSAAVVEKNKNNYLSAGEMALPVLYGSLFVASLITTGVWAVLLYKRRARVFKTHLVMLLLVFVKSFTLLFHAINYHYIAKEGIHEMAWAVLYYITYLLRGALLFISIILIGAGWTFIKHILSKRDKKIFVIVIPLQILANVAYIIMEESEQSSSNYGLWQEILILVDLVCCGAILFPIIWSIKHLQEASNVDGKVAINIEKLKIFRHFYIIIVGYIYFTRIIVYFLSVTVPFSYLWTVDLSRELAVMTFYILTGYMFRPASNNPYMRVAMDECDNDDADDDDGGEVVIMDHLTTRDATFAPDSSNAEAGLPSKRPTSDDKNSQTFVG